jgi:hypothetical protein
LQQIILLEHTSLDLQNCRYNDCRGRGLGHLPTVVSPHLNVTYISRDKYALNITPKYCHARTRDHHRGEKNVSVKRLLVK